MSYDIYCKWKISVMGYFNVLSQYFHARIEENHFLTINNVFYKPTEGKIQWSQIWRTREPENCLLPTQ
jgi:hypothetical protein